MIAIKAQGTLSDRGFVPSTPPNLPFPLCTLIELRDHVHVLPNVSAPALLNQAVASAHIIQHIAALNQRLLNSDTIRWLEAVNEPTDQTKDSTES
jgi:hypothetical protein